MKKYYKRLLEIKKNIDDMVHVSAYHMGQYDLINVLLDEYATDNFSSTKEKSTKLKWAKNRIGLAFMEHEQGETNTAISMLIDCIKVIADELE